MPAAMQEPRAACLGEHFSTPDTYEVVNWSDEAENSLSTHGFCSASKSSQNTCD